MRTIKFKAVYRDKVYQPYEIKEIHWSGNILHFILNNLANVLSHSEGNQRLLQFTGLLDKNGKEIYEGDIVRVGSKKPIVVRWHKDTAGFLGIGMELMSNTEVIGNIYENSELLTAQE